ncbi:MAG: hypothetical protein C4321_08825, partial [Chloroflexota bacterium]
WPLVTGAVNRQVSSERRATVLSIGSMVLSVSMAVLAPFIGWAVDVRGVGAAFALGAVVTTSGVLVFGPAALGAWRHRPETA